MNETIGVKGGKNDRKRFLTIENNKKKNLIQLRKEKELKDLEDKVKKQQKFTLIKALPIAIGGGVVRTIYEVATGEKKKDLEEVNSKWKIKEYDADVTPKTPLEDQIDKIRRKKIIITPDGDKVVVFLDYPDFEKKYIDKTNGNENDKTGDVNVIPKIPIISDLFDYPENDTKNNFTGKNLSDIDYSGFDEKSISKLEKLKSRKIVSEYEKKLKDLRYDLRNIVYEYNVLINDEKEIVFAKDAEIIIDELSDLISKIEELKYNIKIDNIDLYDENYVYYLIEGYMDEFRDKNAVSGIKDSPLYIMISEKLDDLDKRKDDLLKRVDEKKEKLEDKEEKFNQLKEKYYSIDKLNEQLAKIQADQAYLLRELKDKIDHAVSVRERIRYEMDYMNSQTNKLLNFTAFQMFLPGPRFIRGLVGATALHMNFMRNIIDPHIKKINEKVVNVKDYSDSINKSLSSIDDAIILLGKTSSDIDKLITDLKDKYSDYAGVVKEFDQIINNLYKIKDEISEKEYELTKIKKEQEKQLERNNAKVLTRGVYPVK